MKIFVSHVNAHQRVTSVEKDFNIQVDGMACSVDTGQSPFPATLSSHSGFVNMAIVAGMEILQGLFNIDFHSPGLT